MVELLIYAALLALLLMATANGVSALVRGSLALRAGRATDTAARAFAERFVRETHAAFDVDTAASILGSSPSTLVLKTKIAGADSTVTFALAGGIVTVREGAAAAVPITPSTLEVSSLLVRRAGTASTSILAAEIVVRDRRMGADDVQTFGTSAVLRGNY